MTFLKLLGAIHSADRNVAVEGVQHALMDETGLIRIHRRNRRLRRALRVSVFAADITTGTQIPGTPVRVYGLASDSARYASRVDRIGVHRIVAARCSGEQMLETGTLTFLLVFAGVDAGSRFYIDLLASARAIGERVDAR
jgi:hypothetical protein